jgi:hypothetical protein
MAKSIGEPPSDGRVRVRNLATAVFLLSGVVWAVAATALVCLPALGRIRWLLVAAVTGVEAVVLAGSYRLLVRMCDSLDRHPFVGRVD